MSDAPVLSLEQVEKRYRAEDGEVHAVDGVNLEIRKGEFVALHGPSGCGKSTLMLVAGTLLRPDAGKVLLCGADPYRFSMEDRAIFRSGHVGFVFQQFHLVPYLNVMDNVLAPQLARPLPGAVKHAEELLSAFQLGHRLKHRPSALSVGEQQRVALARALLPRPELLLADEPTGNLDPESGEIVLETLGHYASLGNAVLMVTHEPRARDRADRKIGMSDGRLLA